MDVFQDVCPDDSVEVSLHLVEYTLDVLVVLCTDHIEQSDNILVSI